LTIYNVNAVVQCISVYTDAFAVYEQVVVWYEAGAELFLRRGLGGHIFLSGGME